MHLAVEHSDALPAFVQELVALNRYAVVERYEIQPLVTALDRVRPLALVERFQGWVEGAVG